MNQRPLRRRRACSSYPTWFAPGRVAVAALVLAVAAPVWAQLRVPAPAAAASGPQASRPAAATAAPAPSGTGKTTRGDYIVAIVNQELVTAGEMAQRVERVRESAARGGSRLPPEDELRRQVMDALIDSSPQRTS